MCVCVSSALAYETAISGILESNPVNAFLKIVKCVIINKIEFMWNQHINFFHRQLARNSKRPNNSAWKFRQCVCKKDANTFPDFSVKNLSQCSLNFSKSENRATRN